MVKTVGTSFLSKNNMLESIIMPEIQSAGNCFLNSNKIVKIFYTPKLLYLSWFSFYELLKSNGCSNIAYNAQIQIELVRNIIERNNKTRTLNELKDNLKEKPKKKVLKF